MVEYYDANSAMGGVQTADDVGNTAAFLCSPLGAGISGATIHVDKGYHAMGMAVDPDIVPK
jgi:enoyl-[acyl-carrier protein] reductase I